MPDTTTKRLLVIDGHPVCRQGVSRILARNPEFKISQTASSVEEALLTLPHSIDIIVFDFAVARSKGIGSIRELKNRFANARILVLSDHDETLFAERCLKSGASGYLMKTAEPEKIALAMRAVGEGQLYVSDRMRSYMLRRISNPDHTAEATLFDRLSDRELLIVQHIGLSKNNKEIASDLQISVKTIESHRSRIKAKLQLATPQELMRCAMRVQNTSFA